MIETLNKSHETVNYKWVNGVRLYHNIKTDSFPPHWHKEMEVIMPLTNCYSIQMGFASPIETIYENDIAIIPSGEMHTIYAPSFGERIIINVNPTPYTHLTGIGMYLNTLEPLIIRETEYPELSSQLKKLLMDLEEEYNRKDTFCEAIIFSQLINFFSLLGRENAARGISNSHTPELKLQYVDKFADACSFINEQCTQQQLHMETVAASIGFSKYHFCRLFKEFVGCTFHDYVTSCRLSQVQRLLAVPSLSITEIALLCGFSSLATFNRIFKQKKNCTPTEYRNLLTENAALSPN